MRNIKKIVTLGCIAACAAVMLCSCGNKKALASISLASPITLQLGESKEVEITGILRDGTTVTGDELDAILKRKGMHYESSSDNVASIDQNGLLTANNSGTTEISITSQNKRLTAGAVVNVVEPLQGFQAYTYIIDIGGYTTDVVKFSRGGQVDMTFCESFNNGVIKMYDEVQRAVRNRFQLDMDDYSIDNVLRRGYNPGREINELVHSTARSYARTLIRTLKEKGVDLTLSYPVFIGGGSCLMRPVIESELGRDDYLFVEDPRANAVGFKMMAESKLAAENR